MTRAIDVLSGWHARPGDEVAGRITIALHRPCRTSVSNMPWTSSVRPAMGWAPDESRSRSGRHGREDPGGIIEAVAFVSPRVPSQNSTLVAVGAATVSAGLLGRRRAGSASVDVRPVDLGWTPMVQVRVVDWSRLRKRVRRA